MCDIVYQNVRGLNTKITEFYLASCSVDADVILVSESWLTANVLSSELFPPHYNVFRCDREYSRGGGVMAGVKNHMYVKKVNLISPVASIDIIVLKIMDRNCERAGQLIIILLYAPPSITIDDYTSLFDFWKPVWTITTQ